MTVHICTLPIVLFLEDGDFHAIVEPGYRPGLDVAFGSGATPARAIVELATSLELVEDAFSEDGLPNPLTTKP